MENADEGPPRDSDIHDHLSRRYPETPMPGDDEGSEPDTGTSANSSFHGALKVLIITIAIAHLWTVWTLRTDMNIIMQFMNEITQQNKHITGVLHNQRQVRWQIVPTDL